jgi:hypothetical protein
MNNTQFIKIAGLALVMMSLTSKTVAAESKTSSLHIKTSLDKNIGEEIYAELDDLIENKSDIFINSIPIDSLATIEPVKDTLPEVSTSITQAVNPPKKNPSAFSDLNLTNPTSPAAKLIGAGDGKITTISTPSQFGLEVLNGLDNDGKFNTGIAVDTLPYVLIRGNGLTLEEYKSSWIQRFMSNIKLSIATTKALDNVSTARAALGLEFVLINDGDPRMDQIYNAEIEKLQKSIVDDVNPRSTPDELKAAAEKKNADIKKAKAAAEKRSSQQKMWTVALGQSWVSSTGSYSDLIGEGMGFWTTYRQPLGDEAQLLVHASARNGERVSDGNGGFINADTLVGGVRLLSGNRDFRFSLETAYNRESQGGQQINDYLSFGVGFEPRLYDNSWLSVSFGGNTGRQNGTDFQFKTGIKWNINPGYIETK